MKSEKEIKDMIFDSIDSSIIPNKVAEIKSKFAYKQVSKSPSRRGWILSLPALLAGGAAIALAFSSIKDLPAEDKKTSFESGNSTSTVVDSESQSSSLTQETSSESKKENNDVAVKAVEENAQKIGFGVNSAVSAVSSLAPETLKPEIKTKHHGSKNEESDDEQESEYSHEHNPHEGEDDSHFGPHHDEDSSSYDSEEEQWDWDDEEEFEGYDDFEEYEPGPGHHDDHFNPHDNDEHYGYGDHHGDHSHEGEHGWGYGWDSHSNYEKEDSVDDAEALLSVLNPYLSSISAKVYEKDMPYSVEVSTLEGYEYHIGNFYFSLVEEVEEVEEEIDDEEEEISSEEDSSIEESSEEISVSPKEEEKEESSSTSTQESEASIESSEIDEESSSEETSEPEDESSLDDDEEEEAVKEVTFTIQGDLIYEETSFEVTGEYYTVSYGDDSLECLDLYFAYSETEVLEVSQFKYNDTFYAEHFSNTFFSNDDEEEVEETQYTVSYESLSFAKYVEVTKENGHSGHSKTYWRNDSYIEFEYISYNEETELYASVCSSVEIEEQTYELTADLSFEVGESESLIDPVKTNYNMYINSTASDPDEVSFNSGKGFGTMFNFGWGFDSIKGRRSHGVFEFGLDEEGNYVSSYITPEGGEEVDDSSEDYEDDFYDWFDIGWDEYEEEDPDFGND